MNSILNKRRHQRGVGLIEVLVALVVIAVGVIAVLGLQGTLMSGSATSKARNEALALAREKTEELRNAVKLGQFDTDLAAQDFEDDPDTIDGVNAQFTRSWQVVNVTGVENTKELVMRVEWNDAQGAASQVELNTLIAYASPLTSVLSQREHAISPGGETDTGYEGLHWETPMDEEDVPDPRGEDTETIADDESFGITDVLRYSNGHVQVRTLYNEDECAAADKVTEEGIDYCVVFTAFGGTLLRFNGTLYMDLKDNTVKDLEILAKATSPAYCAKKPQETCGNLQCIEYQCYASGDCSIRDGNGDDSGSGGGNGCPDTLTDLPDLNGGWRGRIGHFFYDSKAPYQAPPDIKICMGKLPKVDELGDIVLDGLGNIIWEDNEKISRSYHSLRKDTNNDWWREGINQSYSCHNTLFVKYSETDDICNYGYEEMIVEGIVWNSFKDHQVVRYFDPDSPIEKGNEGNVDNIVMGPNNAYCDLVAIYGNVLIPEDTGIILGEYETATSPSKITFDTVTAEGSLAGECVTGEIGHGGNLETIYACNFIDDSWTGTIDSWEGTITASGTRNYDITTKNPDGPETIEQNVEFLCEGVKDYFDPAATGRNPGEDLSINMCIRKPLTP